MPLSFCLAVGVVAYGYESATVGKRSDQGVEFADHLGVTAISHDLHRSNCFRCRRRTFIGQNPSTDSEELQLLLVQDLL